MFLNKSISFKLKKIKNDNFFFGYFSSVKKKMSRFFSSNVKKGLSIYCKRTYLETLSISELRDLADKYDISFRSLNKKNDLITLIIKHFSVIQNDPNESAVTTIQSLPIVLDDAKRIDIASWFASFYHLRRARLDRFLESKNFKRMQKQICLHENLKILDTIQIDPQKKYVFVHINLALLAASYVDDNLFYRIYDYYLVKRLKEISDPLLKRIDKLELKLLVETFGPRMLKINWNKFNFRFAAYILIIEKEKVYKTGAVGVYGDADDMENLDNRLATHRSTFAKFKLLHVIQFKDKATVTMFEQALKFRLKSYSIGFESDTRLEQYSLENTTVDIIAEAKLIFEALNIGEQGLGAICPAEAITTYNNITRANLPNKE